MILKNSSTHIRSNKTVFVNGKQLQRKINGWTYFSVQNSLNLNKGLLYFKEANEYLYFEKFYDELAGRVLFNFYKFTSDVELLDYKVKYCA